jgi:hypothetical protein
VPDAVLLMARRYEELLDNDQLCFIVPQGDVAGRLIVLTGNEDHIAVHLENPLVAPAWKTAERFSRRPEQPGASTPPVQSVTR